MNCRVVVEAAVPVYDVETPDEAVRIAISKTGEMLNPDLNYVEINMGKRSCPHCGEDLEPAFIAADESLVALELEMTVFNVEREEHAARIARKEIGQRLENIPLEVLEIEELEDDSEAEDDEAEDGGAEDSEAQDGGAEDSEAEDGDADAEAAVTEADQNGSEEAAEVAGDDGDGAVADEEGSESGDSESVEPGDEAEPPSEAPTSADDQTAAGDEVGAERPDEVPADEDRTGDEWTGADTVDDRDDDRGEDEVLPEFEDLIDE
jgi:uncharacterized protein (UPF0212 family)